MKSYTTAQLKSDFSSVVAELKQGNEITITYGRNKEVLGKIIPKSKLDAPNYSLKLGDLQKQGWNYSLQDFSITDDELLGS